MPGIDGRIDAVAVYHNQDGRTNLFVEQGDKKVTIEKVRNEECFDSAVAIATCALMTGKRLHIHNDAGRMSICKIY